MNNLLRNITAGAALTVTMLGTTAAYAASSVASASLDAIFTTTDGTASVQFTGPDFFTAIGTTTGGTLDPASNGEFFASEFGPFGEGTATNGGAGAALGSSAYADASIFVNGSAMSAATTFAELGFELSGVGNVTFEIHYTLDVDAFDSTSSGFAEAGISASTLFESGDEIALMVDGIGFGDTAFLSDVIMISFYFDDFGFGPVSDTLFIETFATAGASAVPVPAAVWLLGSAALSLVSMRRRAHA